MELALNLVWLCVAIAGVLALLFTLSRADAPQRKSSGHGRKMIAMGCTLVILFFVISMTDDLHDQEVLIEERKVLRMTAGTEIPAQVASARTASVAFLFVLLAAIFSSGSLAVARLVELSEFLFTPAIGRKTLRGRAPPVSPA